MRSKIKDFKFGYVLIALALLVMGICFTALKNTLAAIAISIGVTLAVSSVIVFIYTLANKDRGFAF